MKRLSIAIDGPAGAGKSTVAQIVAGRLGYTYIDTGAMFRAVTWKSLEQSIDFNAENEERVIQTAKKMDIKLSFAGGKTQVFVDGTEVTEVIRSREVTNLVSVVAQITAVRKILLEAQRAMAAQGGVVMDGRDIGTNVLPNADIKVFLTASIEERAKRRYQEFKQKGVSVKLPEIKKEIASRDDQDVNRAVAPLAKAVDAVTIDTTNLSIEDVVQKILDLSGV